MSVIVFIIKSCFFFKTNNYNLKQKFYISHFFFLFYKQIIQVICTILAIVIKDLEIYLNNLNLLIKKSAICFELLVQKKEIGKQITDTLYDKY